MGNGGVTSTDASGRPCRAKSNSGLLLRAAGSGLVACLFVIGGAAGIFALHSRADADGTARAALPTSVATITARVVAGYTLDASYAGRLEVARQTAVAFERNGLVAKVTVDEGDEVNQGDIVAELGTAQLVARRDQLAAQRRGFVAQRNLASLTLDRQSNLKKKGWSPDQRYDEAKSNLARLTAEVDRVTAQIVSVDIDIAKSKLTAPFDGRIAKRSIDEGAVVMAGAAIVEVLETDRRLARIGLPPDVAATLIPDAKYTVRVNRLSLQARLISRRPDLESGTRTSTVLFEITGDASGIPIGELVTLEHTSTIAERGAWIPLTALKEGRRGLWMVLVADKSDGSLIVRPEAVELLYAKAGQAFVRGTFKDGAKVISQGTGRVVVGQRIVLVKD